MRHPAACATASCAESLSHCRKYVAVQLLTGHPLFFAVEAKCKLSELLASVAEQMCLQGMQDPDLFGLAVTLDGEYVFVDPESKVGKYAPKAWKTSQSNGLDAAGRPLLQFSLRVKFYVECHLLLRDRVSRHHYYLQLRENVLLQRQQCQQQTRLLLAAWALQADLGSYSAAAAAGRAYFRPGDYIPAEAISELGADSILATLPVLHAENSGMSRSDAELAYIREASAVEAPHNLHIYRLKRRKTDPVASVLLAVCPNGIELYQEEKTNARKLMASFVWTNISKLSFEKKKFEISALTQKFTFYTSSDEKSKHLFHLCKEVHLFTQSLKDRLVELRQRNDDERRSGAGSLPLGGLRSGWEYLHKSTQSASDQRVSVSSNTSSNTTSGIVSDRTVQSLDESDDDLRMEALASSPAVAESVESGVESLPRSHSRLDASSLRSSQHSPTGETEPARHAHLTSEHVISSMTSHTTNDITTSGDLSLTGSAHSSSSQHSGSTVLSRYSLTKLSPKTVDALVSQPSASEGSATSPVFTAAPANCCSTCVDDDSLSVCSESAGVGRAGGRQQRGACGCSATGSDGASVTSGSTLYARQSGSPRSLHTATNSDSLSQRHLSQDSQASAASTTDSTRAVDNDAAAASVYESTSADDSGVGSRHYVDFYEPATAEAAGAARAAAAGVSRPSDSVSLRSGASVASTASGHAAALDYSVHSAHTSVGSVITTPGSFPRRTTVSSTFDTDSDYVQVPYDRHGQFSIGERSAGVSMATVTTVTPVCLAQSQQTTEAEDAGAGAEARGGAAETAPAEAAAEVQQHAPRIVSVPAASAPPSTEAPARFITTRPLVTVFRALASVAVTQSPSFAGRPQPVAPPLVSLPRGFGGAALPAGLTIKPKPVAAGLTARPESLLRSVSHEPSLPGLPVIGRNNYLDVHASHPALSPYPALKTSLRQSPLALSSPALNKPALSRTLGAPQPSLPGGLGNRRPYTNLTAPRLPGQSLLPPPTRPSLATVYTNQVTRTQIEQFQRQLQSDTDYVIYPLKDPDISRQEYIDAKHCSLVAGGLPPPPPYRAPRTAAQYQSTPNVAAAAAGPASHSMTSYLSSPNVAAAEYDDSSSCGTAPRLGPSAGALPHGQRSAVALLAGDSAAVYAGAASSTSSGPTYSSAVSLTERLDSLRRQQHHLSSHSLTSSGTYASSVSTEPAAHVPDLDRLRPRSPEVRLFRAALLAGEGRRRAGVVRAKSDDNLLSSSTSATVAVPQLERPPPPYWQARSRLRDPIVGAPQTFASQSEQQQQIQQLQRQQTLQKHQQLIREHLERIQQLTPTAQLNSSPGAHPSIRPTLGSQPPYWDPQPQQQQQQQQQQLSAAADVHPRQTSAASDDSLDIYGLRVASRQLDLPLISALCNDRLLRRPARPKTWHEAAGLPSSAACGAASLPSGGASVAAAPKQAALPSHPAAGQPILARHKTLALPAFPQTHLHQPVMSSQVVTSHALERRAGPALTSHRHPTSASVTSQAVTTGVSKPLAKKDLRPTGGIR